MAKGFKSGVSSLPAGLKIVGNPRPSSPKENTVWCNTDVEITGYYLSATQPENLVQGNIWIKISDSSKVEIGTPLGNDYITIKLDSVSQYVNGAWVDVEAMSYQDGKWVAWVSYLYKPGMTDVLTPIAWAAVSGQIGVAPVVTYKEDCVEIKLTGGGGSNGVAYFDKQDLSQFSRVHVSLNIEPTFTDSGIESGISGNCFNIWEAVGTGYYEKKYVARHPLVAGQNDFDIPLDSVDGEYYMGIGQRTASSGYRTTLLYEVKLIP